MARGFSKPGDPIWPLMARRPVRRLFWALSVLVTAYCAFFLVAVWTRRTTGLSLRDVMPAHLIAMIVSGAVCLYQLWFIRTCDPISRKWQIWVGIFGPFAFLAYWYARMRTWEAASLPAPLGLPPSRE